MAFKLIALAALVAAANAGIIAPAPLAYHGAPAYGHAAPAYAHAAPAYAHAAPAYAHAAPAYAHAAPAYGYAAPIAKAIVKTIDADYDPNPQYSYSYDVHDAHTGDIKNQQETRNGDVVEGSYSLIEADGTRRVVHYTADPHNGFNAVVSKEPAGHGPVVAKYAAPIAHAPVAYAAAPVVAKYAAPAAYASYAAPAHRVSYAAPAYGYHH